ncbi:hypothetical protein UlMin_004335 [Ulmus minor]
MVGRNWFLLARLRRAVRLLLNFNLNRWRIASMIGGRSFGQQRRLSFNDRPGLRACTEDEPAAASSEDSGSIRELRRTTSYPSPPSDQDDVDQRAEMFIANFRRQLRIERQISLELRYGRENSFEWRSP